MMMTLLAPMTTFLPSMVCNVTVPDADANQRSTSSVSILPSKYLIFAVVIRLSAVVAVRVLHPVIMTKQTNRVSRISSFFT